MSDFFLLFTISFWFGVGIPWYADNMSLTCLK